MKSIGHFLSDKNNWSLIVSALALVVSAIALRKNGFDKTVKRLELTKPIYVELESQLADAIADYSSAITMLKLNFVQFQKLIIEGSTPVQTSYLSNNYISDNAFSFKLSSEIPGTARQIVEKVFAQFQLGIERNNNFIKNFDQNEKVMDEDWAQEIAGWKAIESKIAELESSLTTYIKQDLEDLSRHVRWRKW